MTTTTTTITIASESTMTSMTSIFQLKGDLENKINDKIIDILSRYHKRNLINKDTVEIMLLHGIRNKNTKFMLKCLSAFPKCVKPIHVAHCLHYNIKYLDVINTQLQQLDFPNLLASIRYDVKKYIQPIVLSTTLIDSISQYIIDLGFFYDLFVLPTEFQAKQQLLNDSFLYHDFLVFDYVFERMKNEPYSIDESRIDSYEWIKHLNQLQVRYDYNKVFQYMQSKLYSNQVMVTS